MALRIVTNDIKYFIVKINNPIEYYDLNNGVQKTFYNLKSNTTYIFYGKGIQYQYAKIFFETNSLNDKSLDKVIFYELRNKTYNYYNEKGEIPISFKSSYNQLSTSASYEIVNYYTKLISFRINPLYDIDELNVKINIQGFSYTLSENKEKSISSVISGEQYTFLMRSNLYDLVNITVTTNYIDSKPFTKFIIFESVSQSASFIKNQSLSLTSYKQDNQLVSTTSYLNSYDVAYLLTLKIIPNNGIKYFNIKFNIDKTLFSLRNMQKMQRIQYLKGGRDYYVQMDRSNAKKLEITLIMSYKDDIPFDNLYLSESYRTFDKVFEIIPYKNLNIKKDEDKINATFSYQTSDKYYSYVFLKFTPKYDISYFESYYEIQK